MKNHSKDHSVLRKLSSGTSEEKLMYYKRKNSLVINMNWRQEKQLIRFRKHIYSTMIIVYLNPVSSCCERMSKLKLIVQSLLSRIHFHVTAADSRQMWSKCFTIFLNINSSALIFLHCTSNKRRYAKSGHLPITFYTNCSITNTNKQEGWNQSKLENEIHLKFAHAPSFLHPMVWITVNIVICIREIWIISTEFS